MLQYNCDVCLLIIRTISIICLARGRDPARVDRALPALPPQADEADFCGGLQIIQNAAAAIISGDEYFHIGLYI